MAASTAPIRVPRWAYPMVTVASILLGAAAVVRGTRAVVTIADSDLTNFFFKSADYILRGDIWHMYAVRASGTYPNYNPPLSIILMAPLLAIARALHFAANFGEQITAVSLGFIVFVPLLGLIVLRALRALYPDMPETQRLLAFMLIVLSPLTWQSIATWYHLEQPLMLCFLVAAFIAFQARREWLAGVLAGLALLTRTTALIPLIAFGVLLLASGEWRGLLRLVSTTVLVTVVGLAPFFLFDRADAMYSFVSWRGTAPIGGNSIWALFAYGGTSGIRHTVDTIARRMDMPTVALAVAIVALLAARRLRISAYSRDAWAVLAIAALAVPMLSKTNWPYYYLEPFVLLLIWEFSSMHDRRAGVWRWPVLTFGFLVVAGTLSQYIGLRSVGTFDRIGVGLLEFVAMLAFAIGIWARVQAMKPSMAAAAPAGLNVMRASSAWPAPAGAPRAAVPPTSSQMPEGSGNSGRTPANSRFDATMANGQAAYPLTGGRPETPGGNPRPQQPSTSEEWPDLDAGWPPLPPAPPSPRR